MIIAVDFDGVLTESGHWPGVGDPNLGLMEFLKNLRRDGHEIILWTCRVDDALETAVAFCAEYGLEFDAVNENLPRIVELYGKTGPKVSADYYIDDRAVTVVFERGLKIYG